MKIFRSLLRISCRRRRPTDYYEIVSVALNAENVQQDYISLDGTIDHIEEMALNLSTWSMRPDQVVHLENQTTLSYEVWAKHLVEEQYRYALASRGVAWPSEPTTVIRPRRLELQ